VVVPVAEEFARILESASRFSVRFLLAAALASAVALYIAAVGPYWNISPDSTTYVGWAQALVAGEPYDRGPVQPPVTSMVYAAVLFFFPEGYTALNATTLILILTAAAAVFVWVKRQAGISEALLVVFLTLASTRLSRESTQLLSEPTFMVVSLTALLFVERTRATVAGDAGAVVLPTRRETVVAGTLLLLAVLTRVTGLALVMAVVVSEGWRVVRRQGRANRMLLAFAAVALSAVILWDLFGAMEPYAINWFRNFVLQDVWTTGSATLSPVGILDRTREHLAEVPYAGRLLMNEWEPRSAWLNVGLPAAGLAMCVGGMVASLRRRVSVAALYALIYLGVSIAHALGGGGDTGRILLPILPLLVFFAIEFHRGVAEQVSRRVPGRLPGDLSRFIAVAYVALYAFVGFRALRAGVSEAHSSPFGTYPIKRLSNLDHQRVAMWIRDNSRPDDRFASWQRDMIEVLADRRGLALSNGRVTPADSFVTWLDKAQVRYVIVDHRSGARADSLLSAILQHDGHFKVVTALPGASLYEFIP
jgi:hypothetical protein